MPKKNSQKKIPLFLTNKMTFELIELFTHFDLIESLTQSSNFRTGYTDYQISTDDFSNNSEINN